MPPGFLHTVNNGKLELHFGVYLVTEVVRYKYEKQVWNLLTNSLKKPFDRNFSNSKFVMKDQTNQKTKTTIVIQTLQSSFGCILAPFCEYRHLRVMGTVQCTMYKLMHGITIKFEECCVKYPSFCLQDPRGISNYFRTAIPSLRIIFVLMVMYLEVWNMSFL